MLASMRRAMDKGLLQVVAWVTAISMVLFFSGGGVLLDNIVRFLGLEKYVISINGNKVTVGDFEQKKHDIETQINQIKQMYGPYADMLLQMQGLTGSVSSMVLKTASVDLLVGSILKRFNVKFNQAYKNSALIKQIPQDIAARLLSANGTIDMNALQYWLAERGYSLAQFERGVNEGLKNEMAMNLINSGLFIPKFLLNSRIDDAYGLKKYAILSFDFNKYLQEAKKKTLDSNALKAYYESNKVNYLVPEKRSVTVWTFSPVNYGANVSDKEISALYEKNRQKYLKEPAKIQFRRLLLSSKLPDARQKAMQIKSEIVKDPAKFAELVKQYSDDKSTVSKGGLIDFAKKEDLEEAVGSSLFALENDGDVSDILTTPAGLEILQRVARKPATYKQLSEVEKELKEMLLNTKFTTSFNLDAKKVAKDGKKNPDAVENFAKQKKAVSKNEVLEKNNTAISKSAFGLKEGALSFFMDNNTGYIVKLNVVEKSHLPSFEAVEGKVKEDLYKVQAVSLMKDAMQKAQAELASGSPKEVADKFGAKLDLTGFINSESKEELSKLSVSADILNMQKRGAIKNFVNNADNQGFVAKLVDVKQPKVDDIDTAKKLEISKNLYLETRDALDKGFIASLAKNAKIVINDEQFNQKKRK